MKSISTGEAPRTGFVARVRREKAGVVLFGVASLVATWRFWSISGGRTFHFDEWAWVLRRNEWSVDNLLSDHNGHLSLFPAAVYLVMFNSIGLSAYGAYMLLGYFVHFLVCLALFHVARRRLGNTVALAIGVGFMYLGTIAQNSLWPFQIGFMSSVLGYLVARLALDGHSRNRELLILGGLLLSLGSSGIGVPVFAAVSVEVLLKGWRGRKLLCIAVPGVLYALWYLTFSKTDTTLEFWQLIPKYARDSAAAAVAGVFGYTIDWGLVSLGMALTVFLWVLARRRKVSATVIGALVYLASFWSLTCLSRAQYWDVGAGRYIYAALPPLIIILLDLVPQRPSQITKSLLLGAAVLSIWGTWDRMDNEAYFYRSWGQSVAAELLALELHRESAPDDYFPDRVRAPDIFAASYFATIDKFGSSPAATLDELPTLLKDARIEFDRVSIELGDLVVTPFVGPTVSCGSQSSTRVLQRLRLTPGENVIRAERADITVGFRRFANRRLEQYQAVVKRGTAVTIDVRPDSITRPWILARVSSDGVLCPTTAL